MHVTTRNNLSQVFALSVNARRCCNTNCQHCKPIVCNPYPNKVFSTPFEDAMKVIVTGATGLVGSAIVRFCIDHPEITSIVVISRRSLPISVTQNDKVTVILHDDFLFYPEELLAELDDAVACLWLVLCSLKPQKSSILD